MKNGIVRLTMTELNTSRLFSEQSDSWGREQRGTRSLCESQRPATSHPMEHFSSWGREQCGTRPLREAAANDELSNVSLCAAKSDKGVSTS